MGCDIHSVLEKKTEHGWVVVGKCDRHGRPHRPPLDDRNYEVFAVIAGVRPHIDSPEPVAPPRGIPPDIAPETRTFFDDWVADAHSASWLNREEVMEAVQRLGGVDEAGELGDLLYVMSKLDEEGTPSRVVFWFDN